MPYIYRITNLINGKQYIGKTSLSSIEQRFQQHIEDSKRTRKEKRPLYQAFNKYGTENFVIDLIEKVEDDEIASKRQTYWIQKLRTYIGFNDSNGYNATLGGDGKRLYNYKELANEYLKIGTIKNVCLKYKCDQQTVRQACKENNIPIRKSFNQRKIVCYDPKTKTVTEYSSVIQAARHIPNKEIETARKNISRALNVSKTHIAYEKIWNYID